MQGPSPSPERLAGRRLWSGDSAPIQPPSCECSALSRRITPELPGSGIASEVTLDNLDAPSTAGHISQIVATSERFLVECQRVMHTEFVAGATTYSVVTALSHVGLIRNQNEDSLVVGQWTVCAAETEAPQTFVFPPATPVVVAVADGLGGHPGGDVASSLVVRELARAAPTLDGDQRLRDVLHACNKALYGIAADQPTLMAMGTTVAGVLLTSDQVFVFNVGDSRVYMHGPEGLRQVSIDDRPPPVASQEHTSIVTQTLGGGFAYADIDSHISTFPQSTEVRWLICSDGLSDLVGDDALNDLLQESEDSQAAFGLWEAAIDAGGSDNITLALVRVAN